MQNQTQIPNNECGNPVAPKGEILYFKDFTSSDKSLKHYYDLGECLRGQGKIAEAAEAWKKALELAPNDLNLLLSLGSMLADSGRIEEAGKYFGQAVALDKHNVDANYFMGMFRYVREDYKAALTHWKRCLHYASPDVDVSSLRMCLAEAYRADKRFTKAIYQLGKILDEDPYNLDAHNVLGMIFFEKGDKDKAMNVLSQAVKVGADFYRTHLNLGVVYFDRGAMDLAIHEFRKAARLNPEDADSLFNLGRTLATVGQVDEAVEVLNKSLKADPNQPDCRSLIGNIELVRGNFAESRKIFSQLNEEHPHNLDILCSLAEAEQNMNYYKDAEDHLLQARSEAPDSSYVYYSLALLYVNMSKRQDAALENIRTALTMEPNNPDYHLMCGDLLHKKGQSEEAKVHWKKAAKYNPDLIQEVRQRCAGRKKSAEADSGEH